MAAVFISTCCRMKIKFATGYKDGANMNRSELKTTSEAFIRQTLRKHLQANVPVYLFGSRANDTARWNSDYDLWIDADLPSTLIADIQNELDESFVPFKVDIVITPKLRGKFGEIVKLEAKPWM